MSRVRSRFLKDYVTIWSESTYDAGDRYSKSWTTPVSIKCNYLDGGEIQRDNQGAEFSPSATYRCKDYGVKVGDRVALGVLTSASPPDNAETVRKVKRKTTLVGSADMTFYTG